MSVIKKLRIGLLNDLKGAWKRCFIALFFESIEEIAKKAVKQHIYRISK